MKTTKVNKLLSFERLSLWYVVFTSIIIIVVFRQLDQPIYQLVGRVCIVAGMFLISWSTDSYLGKDKLKVLIRVMFQIAILPFWYSDIYEFNKLLPNYDHVFAALEQIIFGFQPAIEFSRVVSHKWFSEAIYFGYFAYYPIIVGTIIYSFFCKSSELSQLAYLIMGSFFSFYLIFIFLPVAGPQFYYLAIGVDSVSNADFYPLGDYFRNNIDIMAGPGYLDGLFYRAVEIVQAGGERPIAAFPSSHVGVSTVLMLWTYSVNRKLTLILLPVYLLLCCATVYIQAHYLIDVFAGWLMGWLLFKIFRKVYIQKNA